MNKLFDLSGKTAIVTGTSRGLGQYFARALAKAGADLVITSRDVSRLTEFKKEIESLGRKALPVKLDVLCQQEVTRVMLMAVVAVARTPRNQHDLLAGHLQPLELNILELDLHGRSGMQLKGKQSFLC